MKRCIYFLSSIYSLFNTSHFRTSPDRARAAYDTAAEVTPRRTGVQFQPSKTRAWCRCTRPAPQGIAELGAPLGYSARDGRTLHLVVPALPRVAPGEQVTEEALADAFIAQFAQDTATYCGGVAEALARSVPKAIMRLLVQPVEESMEDSLMARVVKLGDYEIATALERDPAAGEKKLRVVKALAQAELRLGDLAAAGGARSFEPVDAIQ